MKHLLLPVLIALLPALAHGGELLPAENNADISVEPPPATDGSIAIEFAPPPTEGTISLGLYNADGKLIRVLRQQATAADFEVGLNGLIARWDGKNDGGETVPAGTYSARGISVGDLVLEGEAYLGNDWVGADGTPRLKQILGIQGGGPTDLLALAEDNHGKKHLVRAGSDGAIISVEGFPEKGIFPLPVKQIGEISHSGGKVTHRKGSEWVPLELPELAEVIAVDASSTGTIWLIDKTGDRHDVKEYSLDGKFLRHLGILPNAPQPVQIVSAQDGRMLYLLEESPQENRVRALALVGSRAEAGPGAEEISTWEVVFSQSIQPAASAEQAGDLLSGFNAEPTVEVSLHENALQPERTGEKAALSLLQKDDRTELALADGLPLQTIATTPGLKWSQLGRRGQGEALTVVQSDGLVIEEFTIHRPGNLASFDAGEYRFPKELPAPQKEQNLPEPTPDEESD